MRESLTDALTTLRSRYGPQALHHGSPAETAATWPTAVPVVDSVVTPGGFPRGRITLLAAASEPSGRLTLLQSFTALASRSCDTGYIDLTAGLDPGFLADLGADLGACLVVRPEPGRWERGLVMARALVVAGLPWLGIAFGRPQPRPALWEHALAALAEAVAKHGTVCVVATPAPIAAPLRHASSLTLGCTGMGWHRANGDVAGLRVLLTTVKSKLGAPGAEATVLLRHPRPYAVAEVVGMPTVVTPRLPLDRIDADVLGSIRDAG